MTPEEWGRFMRFVVPVTETGCWLWLGNADKAGYGRFDLKCRTVLSHRAAYEHARGPIPPGLDADHKCRVRSCVNPDHIEPVTERENNRRRAAAKTHCKSGHLLSGENVRIDSSRGVVARVCRACAARRMDELKARADNRERMLRYWRDRGRRLRSAL